MEGTMNYQKGDVVELIYMDQSGQLSQRHVKVIHHNKERLVAYCYTRRKFRSFKTENILGIRKVKSA
jgi:predicted DNA-binding transcriptional regulator YafY